MAAEPDPTLSPKEPATRVPLSIEKGIAALAMAALTLITLGNVSRATSPTSRSP